MSSFFYKTLFFVLLLFSCSRKNKTSSFNQAITDTSTAAIQSLTSQIAECRTNPDLFFQRAKAYFSHKKTDEALDDVRVAIKLDSVQSDYYYFLGDIYYSKRKIEPAKEAFEKCVRLDEKHINALLKLAEIYLLIQNQEKTAEYLKRVLEIEKTNPVACFMLGIHFKESGDTGRAIASFRKAVEYDAEYYDAFMELGILLFHKKDKMAVSYLNSALNLKPKSVEAMYAIGMFYQENNEPEKALTCYQNILAIDSVNANAYYNMGYVYSILLKKFDSAIPFFNKAISHKSGYAEAYYMRGLCHEATGKTALAKKDYLTSLDYKENYELAIQGLNRLEDKK